MRAYNRNNPPPPPPRVRPPPTPAAIVIIEDTENEEESIQPPPSVKPLPPLPTSQKPFRPPPVEIYQDEYYQNEEAYIEGEEQYEDQAAYDENQQAYNYDENQGNYQESFEQGYDGEEQVYEDTQNYQSEDVDYSLSEQPYYEEDQPQEYQDNNSYEDEQQEETIEQPYYEEEPQEYQENNNYEDDQQVYDGDQYNDETKQSYDYDQQAEYDQEQAFDQQEETIEQPYYEEEQPQEYQDNNSYEDEQQGETIEQPYYEEQPQEYQENNTYEDDQQVYDGDQYNENQQSYDYDQQVEATEQSVHISEEQSIVEFDAIIEEPVMEHSTPVEEIGTNTCTCTEQVLPVEEKVSLPSVLEVETEQPSTELVSTPHVSQEVISEPETTNEGIEKEEALAPTGEQPEIVPFVQESLFAFFESVTLNTLPGIQRKSLTKRPQRKERSRESVGELFKKAESFLEQNVAIEVKDFKDEEIVEDISKKDLKPQQMFKIDKNMLEKITLKRKPVGETEDESSGIIKKEETPKKPSWVKDRTPLTEEKNSQPPPWANALKKTSVGDSTSGTPAVSTPSKSENEFGGKKSLFERKFGGTSDDLSPSSGKLKPSIFGSPLPHSATLPAGFSIAKFKKEKTLEETEARKDETKSEVKPVESPKSEDTNTEENKSEEGPKVIEEKKEQNDDISPVLTPKKAESFRFSLGSPLLLRPTDSSAREEKSNVETPQKGSLKDRIAMLEKKQVTQTPPSQVDFRSVLKKRPANE